MIKPDNEIINKKIADILEVDYCKCEPKAAERGRSYLHPELCFTCKKQPVANFTWATDRNKSAGLLPLKSNRAQYRIFGQIIKSLYLDYRGLPEVERPELIFGMILFGPIWLLPLAWIQFMGFTWDGEEWVEV